MSSWTREMVLLGYLAWMADREAFPLSRERLPMITWLVPFEASSSQVARPMPLFPPVTRWTGVEVDMVVLVLLLSPCS